MKKLMLLVSFLCLCLVLASCAGEKPQEEGIKPQGEVSQADNNASSAPLQELGEDEAMDILFDALGDKANGKTMIASGREEIAGEDCVTIAVGSSDEEKFTAEEHYAVSRTKIYIMDIINGGDYIPFEK